MTKEKIKSIDLFAGIGGIRLGFEQAFDNDIETVFVSEIDEKASSLYNVHLDYNLIVGYKYLH